MYTELKQDIVALGSEGAWKLEVIKSKLNQGFMRWVIKCADSRPRIIRGSWRGRAASYADVPCVRLCVLGAPRVLAL